VLLKHVTEESIEGGQGRRRKQLLDVLKKQRLFWKLKYEATDQPLRGN